MSTSDDVGELLECDSLRYGRADVAARRPLSLSFSSRASLVCNLRRRILSQGLTADWQRNAIQALGKAGAQGGRRASAPQRLRVNHLSLSP